MASRRRTRTDSGASSRVRMTGEQRRAQLLDVALILLAERGYDMTSVEEIAHRAGVSKPVVYEHFGGKEGIYKVVVEREMRRLLGRIVAALSEDAHPRVLIEQATSAFLDYVAECQNGFRILVRDSPATGTFSGLLGEIAAQVEDILGTHFERRGFDPALAALYSQALVGMVALVGQWWLDRHEPGKPEVVAHLVNLAWNGLSRLEPVPGLSSTGT